MQTRVRVYPQVVSSSLKESLPWALLFTRKVWCNLAHAFYGLWRNFSLNFSY